jgi:hypothetical protein
MSRINWRALTLHAATIGVANAVVQLVSAFGVNLSGSQDASITCALNAILILLSAAVISSTNGNGAKP